MTNNQPAEAKTPAEEIRRLLGELHGEITTREKVPHYRTVRRASDRTVAVLDWRTHTVHEPGLLTQLGVTTGHPGTVPVEVYRWDRTDCPCDKDKTDRCRHDRRVFTGVEHRPISGVATAGGAVPSGSPGWDADGALTPLIGGTPDPGEPIADAWHTGDDIRHELANLGRELHAEGWRPPATLVTIALDDTETGEWIAARLRGLVARARVAADYDAPAVPLRDIHCRRCGGQLRVRADASSAVWCEGWLPIQGPAVADDPDWPADSEKWGCLGWSRCGARWPRGAWIGLLAEADRETQAS